MSEESISIEETNKLRLELGLKPIPTIKNEPIQSSEDNITLSETNRLRISLGLKPIEEDVKAPTDQQTTEEYQANVSKLKKEESIKKNLEVAKSKALKRKKISISKSLLDDEESQDTDDWLSKIKKPTKTEKKQSVKRIRPSKKDEDSSRGIKVAHNIEDLTSIETDVVLTLKDKSIFEEGDDELESDILIQKQKLDRELAEKLRSNKYDKTGDERNLLDRYEEQINGGDKEDFFMLDSDTIKVDSIKKKAETESKGSKNKIKFNLDLDIDEDEYEKPSDYATAKPIKMKKLKKKSKQQTRQREALNVEDDGDIILERVEVRDEDSKIQDDEELQSILNITRVKNQKKKKKTPEQLAKEIKEAQENEMEVDSNNNAITIDETTEFLGSIKRIDEDEDEDESIKPVVDLEKPLFENAESDKMEVDEKEQQQEQEHSEEESIEDKEQENNDNLTNGLGGILNLLKSKNIVQERTKEQLRNEQLKRELKGKQDLAKMSIEIEKRIHIDNIKQDPEFLSLSKKDRETVLQREIDLFKEVEPDRDVSLQLKDYKPEINLKYIDEYGREMNQKEAYKQLSHQFHGKAASKSKREKERKKIEKERSEQYKASVFD